MHPYRSVRAAAVASVIGLAAMVAAVPPVLAGGDDVKALNVGDYHGCAVKTDATVWCWGDDSYEQIADGGSTDPHFVPAQVRSSETSFLTSVKTISPGGYDHTCAVRSTGTVRCWGSNSSGELGDLSNEFRAFAVTVKVLAGGATLGDVKALALGQYHSCALKTDGTVWCWGDNPEGQLGDGTTEDRYGAVQVKRGSGFLAGVKAIGAGYDHTCAIRNDSTVRCWGKNDHGQLGIGTQDEDPHSLPLTVKTASGPSLSGVTSIDGGQQHTCALRSDGTVRCWGGDLRGGLGNGAGGESPYPVKVRRGSGFLTDATSVAAGGFHSCASTSDGKVFCWGNNADGELGIGETPDSTQKAVRMRRETTTFGGAKVVRAGDSQTCVLKRDTTVWCTGYSEYGQVGSGTTETYTFFPERVAFP